MACGFLLRSRYLVLWVMLNAAIFTITYHKYLRPQYYYLHTMLGRGLCVSRASATVININAALVLLPVCRGLNSLVYRTLNQVSRPLLTFWLANLKTAHITLAIIIVCAAVVHSVAHIVNAVNFSHHFNSQHPEINWAKYKGQSPLVLVLTSVVGLSGLGMLFILVLMLVSSLPCIRQSQYDLFWTTHFLFLPFLILLVIHPLSGVLKEQRNYTQGSAACLNDSSRYQVETNCSPKPAFVKMECQGWLWVLAALAVFTADFVVRLWRRNQSVFRVSRVEDLPGGVTRLTLTTQCTLVYKPGQYVLLQCPRFSSLEWHPFTVASLSKSSSQTSITVLIRKRGDWTKAVCKMISNDGSNRILPMCRKPIRLLVDGPFCSPMESIVKNGTAICIAAGIGITPFMAVLNYLNQSGGVKPSRLHLVWVVRTYVELSWAAGLITDLLHKFWFANQPDRFDVSFFVTRHTPNKKLQFNALFDNLMKRRIHTGRPEWTELFTDWKTLYNKKQVPVFICGPQLLIKQIKTTADMFNNNGSHFKCIHESFS